MNMVMILVDFLIPALMLLFGLAMWKAPSHKVDKWYGYRTRRALKSREAYVFAQIRMGRIWTWTALLLGAAALILALIFGRDPGFTKISLALLGGQVLVMVLAMIPVERALKKKFG